MNKTEIESVFKEYGARKSKSESYHSFTHCLPTKIGMLFFKIDTEGKTISIFGNFLNDVDKAKKLFNSSNSKYNFHALKDDNRILIDLKGYIERVLN